MKLAILKELMIKGKIYGCDATTPLTIFIQREKVDTVLPYHTDYDDYDIERTLRNIDYGLDIHLRSDIDGKVLQP